MSGAPPPGCALAVIAKQPVPGLVKTRLAGRFGPGGAARAAAAMLADTLATVRTVGAAPWLCYAPAEAGAAMAALAPGFGLMAQRGGGLGPRLAACVRDLLAGGAERVAVVGADTPQLPAATYVDAFERLDEHDVVLGPALDGGYYLVALKTWTPDLFSGVRMGTATVLAETIALATAAGRRVGLLAPARDLDRPGDLAAALDDGELATSPATAAVAAELLAGALP